MSTEKPNDILRQIERDLLAEKPLDTLLRKLILLGGNSGSVELRQWAAAELRGYDSDDDLPSYRHVNAPIQIDGLTPSASIQHQTISTMDLPDFARSDLNEVVPLRMGVREIQSLADRRAPDLTVKLQPPGSASLVWYMNRQDHINGQITSLYWSVSTVALEGVLDQVRTRLAELIAELRSGTPYGRNFPTPDQAANAVNLIIKGRGNRVSIAQAVQGSTITSQLDKSAPQIWTRARVVGAAAVGLATIVGTILTLFQFPL